MCKRNRKDIFLWNRTEFLIVDDDPNIREVLSVLLGSEGYSVDQAEDGEEALKKVDKDKKYRLSNIGYYDAWDVRRRSLRIHQKEVSRSGAFPNGKVTGSGQGKAYTEGGDDYLVKPFSQTELLMKVKSLLRRYKEYQGEIGAKGQADHRRQHFRRYKDQICPEGRSEDRFDR